MFRKQQIIKGDNTHGTKISISVDILSDFEIVAPLSAWAVKAHLLRKTRGAPRKTKRNYFANWHNKGLRIALVERDYERKKNVPNIRKGENKRFGQKISHLMHFLLRALRLEKLGLWCCFWNRSIWKNSLIRLVRNEEFDVNCVMDSTQAVLDLS